MKPNYYWEPQLFVAEMDIIKDSEQQILSVGYGQIGEKSVERVAGFQ
jgi:hypothetical protein